MRTLRNCQPPLGMRKQKKGPQNDRNVSSDLGPLYRYITSSTWRTGGNPSVTAKSLPTLVCGCRCRTHPSHTMVALESRLNGPAMTSRLSFVYSLCITDEKSVICMPCYNGYRVHFAINVVTPNLWTNCGLTLTLGRRSMRPTLCLLRKALHNSLS